jgi:hypothetical protein
LVLTGTGAVSLSVTTVAGDGVHLEPVTGTGAVALSAQTVSGEGLHIENATGTGAIALPALVVSGTATAPVTGGSGGRRGTPVVNDDDQVIDLDFFDLF